LAHVLVGEPDATSPGQVLACGKLGMQPTIGWTRKGCIASPTMILLPVAASCLSSFAVMSAQEGLRDPD
jgi:hypothetical protein